MIVQSKSVTSNTFDNLIFNFDYLTKCLLARKNVKILDIFLCSRENKNEYVRCIKKERAIIYKFRKLTFFLIHQYLTVILWRSTKVDPSCLP